MEEMSICCALPLLPFAILFLLIELIIKCLKDCLKLLRKLLFGSDEVPEEEPQHQTHGGGTATNEEDIGNREARRERILLSIIHKRVLSQPSKEKQKRKVNEEDLSSTKQELLLEEDAACPIILPHEESLSSRYQKVAAAQADEEAQAPISSSDGPAPTKDDIYVETLRSIRENSSHVVANKDVEDSLYSPKVCPICCEEYKKGDDIAWSKNESCYHAFHVDCIMEWLMDNNDCPLCRENYV